MLYFLWDFKIKSLSIKLLFMFSPKDWVGGWDCLVCVDNTATECLSFMFQGSIYVIIEEGSYLDKD